MVWVQLSRGSIYRLVFINFEQTAHFCVSLRSGKICI